MIILLIVTILWITFSSLRITAIYCESNLTRFYRVSFVILLGVVVLVFGIFYIQLIGTDSWAYIGLSQVSNKHIVFIEELLKIVYYCSIEDNFNFDNLLVALSTQGTQY